MLEIGPFISYMGYTFFSYSVALPFIFLSDVFGEKQKVLILKKLNLLNFFL
jgi:hypothetical protein